MHCSISSDTKTSPSRKHSAAIWTYDAMQAANIPFGQNQIRGWQFAHGREREALPLSTTSHSFLPVFDLCSSAKLLDTGVSRMDKHTQPLTTTQTWEQKRKQTTLQDENSHEDQSTSGSWATCSGKFTYSHFQAFGSPVFSDCSGQDTGYLRKLT